MLSFDDGPHPEVTPAILDRLDRFRARALFFIVGNRIQRAPHLLEEIWRRGHVIGNHTWQHQRSMSFSEAIEDVRCCQREIERHTGRPPWLLRPPFGKMTVPIIVAACRLRLKIVLWSLDSGDWKLRTMEDGRTRGRELASALAGNCTPSEIILLHDDNRNTIGVLDELLPVLFRSGCDLNRVLGAVGGADGIP